MATGEKRNYLYLYDLPKDTTTSTKLAEAFQNKYGVNISDGKKPQIHRDLFKPFYSAVIHIEDDAKYQEACEKVKYLELDTMDAKTDQPKMVQARSLKFDPQLRGDNKAKVMSMNVFYKPPKGQEINYQLLNEKFKQYGDIRSCKISLNPDFTSRGYAFVNFYTEEGVQNCLADPANKDCCFQFSPREAGDASKKLVNNLYFKNVPMEMQEVDVKKLFEPFGDIKSMIISKNDFGQWGLVCYEDKDGKDKMHGIEAVKKACEALSNVEFGKDAKGETIKMYLRNYLPKEERQREKFVEMIRYKNSKKRCNLYVKNFPSKWGEEELKNLFQQYGEIESVRIEGGNKQPEAQQQQFQNTFAFICFKKPDACSNAKSSLNTQVYEGKQLIINHYEIKEIRDLQNEEIKDKRDWENYVARNGQSGGLMMSNMMNSQGGLTQVIQQLLMIMQQQQPQRQPYQQRQGGQYQGQRQQYNNNQGQRGPPRQGGYNQQQPNPMGQPQQQMNPMMQGGQQPVYNMQQPQVPQQQQQPMTHQQKYQVDAAKLLPAVKENNPFLKEQVGSLIYDYVQMMVGDRAPKITGMLIELSITQIREYLTTFEALQTRVDDAARLLNQ